MITYRHIEYSARGVAVLGLLLICATAPVSQSSLSSDTQSLARPEHLPFYISVWELDTMFKTGSGSLPDLAAIDFWNTPTFPS